MSDSKYNNLKTFSINISGIVQGVGFRPFIYRLAGQYNLNGTVNNTTEGVTVSINVPDKKKAEKFSSDITLHKPAAAIIESIKIKETPFHDFKNFKIGKSIKTEERFQLVSPDIATCSHCASDIRNNKDTRRYDYPFTNCTNCGPRFTIIREMPYDRPHTTMQEFQMCKDCSDEYNDPENRRFHAQPNACKKCGPKLFLTDKNGKKIDCENIIDTSSELLRQGKIISLKSLGGFQIACSALSDSAVMELRKRKKRPVKPFAIMIKDVEYIKKNYRSNEKEIESLISPRAPIVLLEKNTKNYPVSRYVSLYNRYEGVMLPYTPLHHLISDHIDIPLIMTSGNISEEPIAAENAEAFEKLKDICDYFLINDRDIYCRFDDSVIKIFDGREMMIRRARGYSPYPVKLGKDIGKQVVFAAGAHEKNTFCFLVKNYAILSQHIGDLDDIRSLEFYASTFNHYLKLFNIKKIDAAAYDKHPAYASTKFTAKLKNIETRIEVQHHKAHIASVMAENDINGNLIGFAWDGTGYGDDGKIWGSEIFEVNQDLDFIRVGHLKEKLLPGGEISIKKPYRMAVSYLYHLWKSNGYSKNKFYRFLYENLPFYKKIISKLEIEVIEKQMESGFNSPVTTSMGRLFDAVSSVLDYTHVSSFEGEAAIHLEMIADYKVKEKYPLKIDYRNGTYLIDDHHIFSQIFKDLQKKIPKDKISARFHNTLASAVLEISNAIRKKSGICRVGLSGGVFQNNFLLKRCFDILKKEGFEVYSNFNVPVNDGGISLGQSYISALRILTLKKKR